jgi:hypothetical protein
MLRGLEVLVSFVFDSDPFCERLFMGDAPAGGDSKSEMPKTARFHA